MITSFPSHRSPATSAGPSWIKPLALTLLTLLGCWLLMTGVCRAATAPADLYIKDTTGDLGVEPDPDPGIMYNSPDIWVRQTAMSGHTPYAFSVDPAWLTSVSPLHQNPLYRDPKYSRPNYVYVRVRNRGGTASTGTERLRVYWAKASTGLGWPSQWVDYLDTTCGPTNLYGIEITKPRRNVADPGVPQADVDEYRNAILAIGKAPVPASYQFPDKSFWAKQQEVHNYIALFPDAGGFNPHGSDAFLPWHREFINRYEILLRQAFPKLTLFYWDWTTDPSASARITGLMGNFHNNPTYAIGAPFQVAGIVPPVSGGTLTRDTTGVWPAMTPAATIVGKGTFTSTRQWNEGEGGGLNSAHDQAHPAVGGSGNLSDPSIAAEDPFFFLLHGNVDRLWSMWQRVLGDTARYDPATAYTGTGVNVTLGMAPWNGFNNNGTGGGGAIPNVVRPWTTLDGYITTKPAKDASVVFPPIYDTAPLTIPVLGAGQSVVIEIPWYPPNPANFSCFGADEGHVCLLARIETTTNAPYGMTFAEGADINTNVRNNNNIAWKNVSVETSFGPFWISPIWLRNLLTANVPVQLNATLTQGNLLFQYGRVTVDLGPVLYNRWLANGGVAQGFVPVTGTTMLQLVASNGIVNNLTMAPNEAEQVTAQLQLAAGYADPQGQIFNLNLEQYGGGTTGTSNQFVGGQQVQFDFNQLSPVPPHSTWHYLATGQYPGSAWTQPSYNDSQWPVGMAKLGYGVGDEATTIDGGPPAAPNITTWFRYDFILSDPGLYHNLWGCLEAADGAVVYLNGVEIQRLRMPAGTITPTTLATTSAIGLAGELMYPANVSQFLSLLTVSNVLAVEVHKAASTGPDIGFDAELTGNQAAPTFPPQVAFISPADGSLFLKGNPIGITANAISPTGAIASVSYYGDGQLLGTVNQPPYPFTWNSPTIGTHQITATATDSIGLTGSAFLDVQVLSNLPPSVLVSSPTANSVFLPTDQIPFSVTATEQGGNIAQVDFYVQPHGTAFTPPQLVQSVTAPPYSIVLSNLLSGGYFLSAVATDNLGAQSESASVFIEVATVPPPVLTMSNAPPYIILSWTPNTALLQQSVAVTGPWQTLSNATSPYQVLRTGPSKFFRAQLP